MDKKLKDLKGEVLVVTNATEGNTPHVVEDIEPEGGLKTRPLAGAKPLDQFMRIDRNVSILETFFLNMKRQFERPSDFRFYHLPVDLLASAKELVGLFKQPESNSACWTNTVLTRNSTYRAGSRHNSNPAGAERSNPPAGVWNRWTGSSLSAWG
ncbi:hypothetical protein [Bacteroides finegoldii]|jgi:hypothetical protein|uniref:hypothetical protein n=1 Tax=Bacteroides finegoldii TaxID=338188 RepID=UPI00234E0267|nr:hypothetical protein [Bacteroides finegoldii]MDC7142026.1 hypothetical protein [Bacteroides finegoldii]